MATDRRRFAFGAYDLASYDDNLCLKPPFMLWLVMLYLSRALVMPIVGTLTSTAGSSDMASWTRAQFGPETILSAAGALIVLLAALRRVPSASKLTRFIWANGRIILGLSAIGDLALSIIDLRNNHSVDSLPSTLLVVRATLDAYFLIYVFGSRRVGHVFSDFPVMPG